MAELKPCPCCGGDGALSTNVNAKIVYGSCWDCGARGPVVQYKDRCSDEDIAEAIDRWNRRPPEVKARPEPNLDGKCGSCEHSVIAVGHFGNSKCYVECKNQEHLSSRNYYGRPLVAVRQRTAKGCKYYKRRAEDG